MKYRNVQIYSNLQNNIFKKQGLQIIIGGLILGETFIIDTIFESCEVLPLSAICVLIMLALQLFCFVHMHLKAIATPFEKSIELIMLGRQQKNKLIKVFMRSWSPIPLAIGDRIHFDKLT